MLQDTTQLKISQYLHTGDTATGGYAYHRLFSNLKTLNPSARAMLLAFRDGARLCDVRTQFGGTPEVDDVLKSFVDMYYLCEPGSDEREVVERAFADREERLRAGAFLGGLQLSVSNVCNFTCSYCFTNTTEARRRSLTAPASEAGPTMMSFEVAKTAIEKSLRVAKLNGRKKFVVKFFGLEPLTNWKTIRRVIEHFGRGEAENIKITYAITSNGSLITEEIASTFKQYDVHSTISIDGTRKANNLVRTARGQADTFESIDRGIALLAKHGVKTNLSAVITDANFHDISVDFIDYAKGYGTTEVQVLLGMQDDYLGELTTSQVVDKLFDLYTHGVRVGVSVTGYWFNPFAQLYNTKCMRGSGGIERGTIDSCTATGYQLNVEPSGNIFPCKAMSTHLGHIDRLEEMFQGDPYRQVVMRTYGNVSECKSCAIEGFCQGECLGNMEQKFKDIYRVDPRYCDIYRGITLKIVQSLGVAA